MKRRFAVLSLFVVGAVAAASLGASRLEEYIHSGAQCALDPALREKAKLPVLSLPTFRFTQAERRLCAPDAAARAEAVHALGSFGDLGAKALTFVAAQDPELENPANDALATLGAAGVQGLIRNVRRESARRALARIGPPAMAPLVTAFDQGTMWVGPESWDDVWVWVANVLERIGSPDTTRVLLDGLDLRRPGSAQLLAAFWQQVGPAFIDRAIADQMRPPGTLQTGEVLALRRGAAADLLLEKLDPKKPALSEAVVHLLAQIPPTPGLLQRLWDDLPKCDPDSRATWLVMIAQARYQCLENGCDNPIVAPAARDVLFELMKHPEPSFHADAMGLIGDLDDERAVPALSSALQDDNVYVRKAAVDALERNGSEAATAALRRVRATEPGHDGPGVRR
jgi:HEAT repeat protein